MTNLICLKEMKKIKTYSILVLLAGFTSVLVLSCKKDPDNTVEDNFQKGTLMENVASNIILIEYNALDQKLIAFENAYQTFLAAQNPTNFDALKQSWSDLYLQWEKSCMFEFGPAMSELLKSSLGTFPTDSATIVNNISSGSYDLDAVSNFKAQGIPAFDFLLHRDNASSYFSDPAYAQYATNLITKMRGHVTSVISQWNGGYANTFETSTGTEVTSAFSQFVNQFCKSYEELKWTKLGIPLGNQIGTPQPDYIETRRAKQAFPLMIENMKALHRLFKGDKGNGETGIGFDDYLIAVERQDLTDQINSSFADIISDMEAFQNDFETELNTNPQALQALFNKIQALTVYLKTDMTSAFAVLITYQDNDGD
jgi:predicted lipoprotein